MKNFNTNTTNNDEWLTPPWLVNLLGPFDLDPCAPVNRPWDTAKRHYNKLDDGMSQPWEGRVWLNPPYGRQTFTWLRRLAEHKDGGIALTFARTETQGFFDTVWNRARCVFFFKGRLKFHYVDGREGNTANAPSVLVAYTNNDLDIIRKAWSSGALKGQLGIL